MSTLGTVRSDYKIEVMGTFIDIIKINHEPYTYLGKVYDGDVVVCRVAIDSIDLKNIASLLKPYLEKG